MRYTIFLLWFYSCAAFAGIFDDYDWPLEYFNSYMDKVNWEVNQKYSDKNNACLEIAKEKQKILGGNIVIIKRSLEPEHAILVFDSFVLDCVYQDILPIEDALIVYDLLFVDDILIADD